MPRAACPARCPAACRLLRAWGGSGACASRASGLTTATIVQGYGWAAAVELLCTAFQQGPFGPELAGIDRASGAKKPMPLGHIFLAIDVAALSSLAEFKKSAGAPPPSRCRGFCDLVTT